MITLRPDGFFERDGRVWIPCGFNYWPPESGVECWTEEAWSPAPFARDFHAMRNLGFDCVRMFLRWPEFQPTEDDVSPVALARLREVGDLAAEAGILLIPTLFVGFMSGGLYPPPWLGSRNLFTDPECIAAAARLATAAARTLAPSGTILAYDLSNEINVWCNHLPPVTADQAISWHRQMAAAIRLGHPGALVVNGTNHTGIIAEIPWDVRNQSRVPADFLSMHVYPVRHWNALQFASLDAYEADVLSSVHIAMARAYGPVMLEEFNVAMPIVGMRAHNYLYQNVVGSFMDGGNGFLLWGWQDFQTSRKPYRDNPFEKDLCFLDMKGGVKEASQGFIEARDFVLSLAGFVAPAPRIAIYLGESYWQGSQRTLANSIRCFWLSTALRRAHLAHEFTDQIEAGYDAIVVPGPRLCLDEIEALRTYVAGGGHVVLCGIAAEFWGNGLKELAEVEIEDMAGVPAGALVQGAGEPFPVPGMPYAPVFTSRGAAIGVTAGDSLIPAVLVSRQGRGPVATLNLPLEGELCEHPSRLRYSQLLGPVFQAWGFAREADGLPAEVEARELRSPQNEGRLVLLNHATTAFSGSVTWRGRAYPVSIPPKRGQAVVA